MYYVLKNIVNSLFSSLFVPVIKPVIDLKIIIFTQLLNKTKNTKLKNSMLIKVSISFNVSDRFGNSAHDFIKFYR